MQKTNEKEFRVEKIIKRKGYGKATNGKPMIIYLLVGLIKRLLYKNELFSTLY